MLIVIPLWWTQPPYHMKQYDCLDQLPLRNRMALSKLVQVSKPALA